MTLLIVVLLVVLLCGGWGYRGGSYLAPGGVVGLVLLIILVLWLTGNLGHLRL